MKYHAPTNAFTVDAGDLKHVAMALRHAIKKVRKIAGLPLEPHKLDQPMEDAQFAEAAILEAAQYIGIDLGATRAGVLDVRDAP